MQKMQKKKHAPLGSTQVNENFNRIVAAKESKNRYYSSLERLCFRVGSAVWMKNLDQMYLPEVYQRVGFPPNGSYYKFCNAWIKKGIETQNDDRQK